MRLNFRATGEILNADWITEGCPANEIHWLEYNEVSYK